MVKSPESLPRSANSTAWGGFACFNSLTDCCSRWKRLWQHRVLVLWTLVGLAAATTLALSLTLYVDAVNTDLLTTHLGDPPYAFRFRYLGSWNGNITPADVSSATAAIDTGFARTIGLPLAQSVNYASGGSWAITLDGAGSLGSLKLSSLDGADAQMPSPPGSGRPICTPTTTARSRCCCPTRCSTRWACRSATR